jgi:hypothetical protein
MSIGTKILDVIEKQGQVYIMFGYDEENEELLLEVEDNTKERG